MARRTQLLNILGIYRYNNLFIQISIYIYIWICSILLHSRCIKGIFLTQCALGRCPLIVRLVVVLFCSLAGSCEMVALATERCMCLGCVFCACGAVCSAAGES